MIKTEGITHEQWLDERRRGIGGSDSPVILLGDDHPFSTPLELWEDKMGIGTPTPESPAMKRGKALEDLISREFMDQSGYKVRRVNQILQHPEHPWMLGNIDRLIVGVPGRGPGILEIKCPGLKTFGKIKREGVPDYYQIQLQHYLAVSGREWGAFAIFNAELWELVWFELNRDDELIEMIIRNGEEFWNLVQAGVQPESGKGMTNIDLDPVGGDENFLILDSDPWERAVREYREAKSLLEETEMLKKEAEERIKNLMTLHNATVVEGAGVRMRLTTVNGRVTFDHKRFQQSHPELEEEMGKFVRVGKEYQKLTPTFLKEEKNYE